MRSLWHYLRFFLLLESLMYKVIEYNNSGFIYYPGWLVGLGSYGLWESYWALPVYPHCSLAEVSLFRVLAYWFVYSTHVSQKIYLLFLFHFLHSACRVSLDDISGGVYIPSDVGAETGPLYSLLERSECLERCVTAGKRKFGSLLVSSDMPGLSPSRIEDFETCRELKRLSDFCGNRDSDCRET